MNGKTQMPKKNQSAKARKLESTKKPDEFPFGGFPFVFSWWPLGVVFLSIWHLAPKGHIIHVTGIRMKIAYLDCFSGISGDMFIGALIDAGLPLEELRKVLQSLPLEGYSLEVTREERNLSSAPASKSR